MVDADILRIPDFRDLQAPRPCIKETRERIDQLIAEYQVAESKEKRIECFMKWDALCKQYDTWENLTMLHFWQDTENLEYKAEQDFADEYGPDFAKLDVKMKKMLLQSEHRSELEEEIGDHVFRLWKNDIKNFDEKIKPLLVEESKLTQKYVSLMASAKFEIDGKTVNFTGLGHYCRHGDREIRHSANKKR